MPTTQSNLSKSHCIPSGSEPLPEGIIRRTSDLEMRTLWGPLSPTKRKDMEQSSKSLLAIAVGIMQKEVVSHIVKKFSSSDSSVILFHYDDHASEWNDLQWSANALHFSALHQTKWWFAKHFLHPDIVAEYDYIFLWDEDLAVEHFNLERAVPRLSNSTWPSSSSLSVITLLLGSAPRPSTDLSSPSTTT